MALSISAIAVGQTAVCAHADDMKTLLQLCEKADLASCNTLLDAQSAIGSYQLFGLMARGKIYYNRQLYEKSYADFSAAAALALDLIQTGGAPFHAKALSIAEMWMAKIDNNQGHYEDAINHAEKALRRDPQNAYAFAARGFAYQNQKKNDLALQDFDSALSINPKLIDTRMLRAGLLLDTDREKADADYTYVEASPDANAFNRHMAHLMLNMRNMPEDAIKRELAALNQQNPSPPATAADSSAGPAPSLDERQLGEDVFVYEALVKFCAPATSIDPADTDRIIHIFQARPRSPFGAGARGAADALTKLDQGESECTSRLQGELNDRRSRIEAALPAVLALRVPFKPQGCDFAVAFPGRPQIHQMSLPNGITYPQAELLFGGQVLRAECLAAPMTKDEATQMQMAQARADVLEGAAVKDISDTVTELRGYKTIAGEPAVYTTRVYRGPHSTLTVLIGSKSADFPMAATLFREVAEPQ